MVLSDGERIARVEGIVEELRSRMNSIENRMNAVENRMNVQIGLTVAMWVSLAGLIVTILIRQ